MATPPDSGGLCISSSPLLYPPGPAEEVHTIFANARQVNTINPDIEAALKKYSSAFTSTFSRQIKLIKSRSQAWDDGHVTVFDKVLLKLTGNGKELDTPAAITYFCREFLGIPESANAGAKGVMLADAVVASVSEPTQAMSPPETQRGSFSRTIELSRSPERAQKTELSAYETENEDVNVTLAKLAAQLEPITGRLWNVYAHSKMEFAAVDNPHSLEKQEAAKFLRDTAENLLHRLREISADENLIGEVAETFQAANVTATTLHGGKKRKFDRASGLTNRERGPSTVIARTERGDAHQEVPRQGKRPKKAAGKELFPGHTSAVNNHRRNAIDLDRDELYYAAAEELPRNGRPLKKKNKGRGHSGIPYGYSRPVDSWYPG